MVTRKERFWSSLLEISFPITESTVTLSLSITEESVHSIVRKRV
jgi:hypothetical protein